MVKTLFIGNINISKLLNANILYVNIIYRYFLNNFYDAHK